MTVYCSLGNPLLPDETPNFSSEASFPITVCGEESVLKRSFIFSMFPPSAMDVLRCGLSYDLGSA